MVYQAQQTRGGTRVFVGEDETQEEIPQQHFCKEIRDFKDYSRRFHEFFANAEGIHNPRSLNRDEKYILEIIVGDACRYPKCYYQRNDDMSNNEKAEYSAIADEILKVSELMVGKSGKVTLEVVFLTMYVYNSKETSIVPLFKIHGNKRNHFTFISKNRVRYPSILSFVDSNDLPHSLVCAAREGSEKTYEIDWVIRKYPLVFFTVNFSKYIDRRSEHRRVWSTIYKNSIVLDIPMYLVWALSQHIHIEVKHFINNLDYNKMETNRLKYKFFKFAERNMYSISQFGTNLNWAIITSVTFMNFEGLASMEELQKTLLLNGNIFLKDFSKSFVTDLLSNWFMPQDGSVHNNFPGSYIGKEYPFEELRSQFKGNRLETQTLNDCSNLIEQLLVIGEKLIEKAEFHVQNVVLKSSCFILRLTLRLLPLLIRKLFIKSEEKNYIGGMGNELLIPDVGDYSLSHFLQTVKEKDIERVLSDKDCVERYVEPTYRKCAAEQNYQIIRTGESEYISLSPIFVTIENFLGDSHQNARIYGSEDNTLYKISTEEALYKIYPFKSDRLNLEIQFIYVEKK